MSSKGITVKIDAGRLLIVPLFASLLAIIMMRTVAQIRTTQAATAANLCSLVYGLLTVLFYTLVIVLYFFRRSAISTTPSLAVKSAAVTATFLPLALPFLSVPSAEPWRLIAADVVMICGITIAITSLWALGKSFSIIPQARSIVSTGPYRFVRHPLYAGELIAMSGIVLSGNSVPAAVVFCAIAFLQSVRAREEERVLAGTFGPYLSYASGKARFLPGIY